MQLGEPDHDSIRFETDEAIARITLTRPDVHNAQNAAMLYALDEAFQKFASDDALKVAIVRGEGPSFSSGHIMLGHRYADYDTSYERVSMWWDHTETEGGERYMAMEQELFLGMAHRWREIPKPTIAAVHGVCIAGGLMLAWPCDLIVASEDATFSDPVLAMGVPGVELFAHPWEVGPRQAKEMLFLAEPITAQRAYELGMVNRVVPRDDLDEVVGAMANKIARMPRFALALAKKAVNVAQDSMGYRVGGEHAFGLHQLAQVHNELVSGHVGGGASAKDLKRAMDDST